MQPNLFQVLRCTEEGNHMGGQGRGAVNFMC